MSHFDSSVREGFIAQYEGAPPWEIGRPQPPFRSRAHRIAGPVLDCGCGTGSTSVFLAEKGLAVTGIDFVPAAIERARARAAAHGVAVEFLVENAMNLVTWNRQFESVVDSGLFHIYGVEDRKRYVGGLAHVVRRGGCVFLYGFSDEEPSAPGGGLSEADIWQVFADGWEVESLESVRGELNPAFVAEHPDEYSPDGPVMRFAIIRRM